MTEKLFLRLLHPAPLDGPVRVTLNELKEMKGLAREHNLLLLLFKRLTDLREHIFPIDIAQSFIKETEGLYYKNAVRATVQQELAAKTISLLKSGGVPALVLRGSSIAGDIYGDPFCRVSADIDILTRISDIPAADDIMRKAGYCRTDELPLKFLLSRIHHAVYRSPDTADLIELHWNFAVPSYFNLTSEEIWQGLVSRDGQEFALSPEMTLIQLLIHHHMHAFRELKILVDILWTIQKYTDCIDWQKFVVALRRTGLLKVTHIALSQMREVWADTERVPAERRLSCEIRQGTASPPAWLLSFFSLDIKKRYLFQAPRDRFMSRLAFDRRGTIAQSFAKTFFPPPTTIRDLYEDRRNWILPVNYLRFIKWRLTNMAGQYTGKHIGTEVGK